jgi:hypothetical protein
MDRGANGAARTPERPSSPREEEPYVSPVPGCILLFVGLLMVLLLAAGWML